MGTTTTNGSSSTSARDLSLPVQRQESTVSKEATESTARKRWYDSMTGTANRSGSRSELPFIGSARDVEAPSKPRERFVEAPLFELVFCCAITINAIVMAMEVQYYGLDTGYALEYPSVQQLRVGHGRTHHSGSLPQDGSLGSSSLSKSVSKYGAYAGSSLATTGTG